jgi:hypothetical protein
MAMLALSGAGQSPEFFRPSLTWLGERQSPEGGLSPSATVNDVTWVGTLCSFLPESLWGGEARGASLRWLLQQMPEDQSFLFRLRMWMLGAKKPDVSGGAGWSWYPGTAAWLTPTAYAVLALRKLSVTDRSEAFERRLLQGQQYLISRQCADGGWNHGSSRSLGYDGDSYPETTGLALMALRGAGIEPKALQSALRRAEAHASTCRSAQGLSLLQMGLAAHGRLAQPLVGKQTRCRSTMDHAHVALAAQTLAGRSVFW